MTRVLAASGHIDYGFNVHGEPIRQSIPVIFYETAAFNTQARRSNSDSQCSRSQLVPETTEVMDPQAGQCPEEREEAQAGREDRAEGKKGQR